MNYYERLNISEDASKMEIKKAYFKMVKQYPPERFPEEFKEYRKAYEVLSDESARAQYDGIKSIPTEYQELYDDALQAMEYRDYEFAIKLLKEVVKENPELQVLNSLLGDIYLENGNSGNAIKTFENLVKLDSDNAGYQGKLAEAYSMRGFTKKAIVQFEKAVEIDPDNISLWKGLAEAYMNTGDIRSASIVYRDGIAKAKENDLNALELHVGALLLCMRQHKNAEMQQHLDVIKNEVENDTSLIDYILGIFFHDFTHYILEREGSTIDPVVEMVDFLYDLAPEHEGLQALKKQLPLFNIPEQFFHDEKMPEGVFILTKCAIEKDDSPSWQVEQALIQQMFLTEAATNPKVRKGIRYLQENYPEAYHLNETFYQSVLDSKKRRHLKVELDNRVKHLQEKYPFEFMEFVSSVLGEEMDFDDDFDDFAPHDPYVRDEPKVGRNDPCPCGSGKKYKKCCGKN